MNSFHTRYDHDDDTRFQCRHIFPDGHRCGSPCLRAEELCYYHHTTRRPIADAPARKARRGSFAFPNPADLIHRSGIQLAIAEVLQRIASNDIDPRRAGLLLYGLQTASLNLPKALPNAPAAILVDDVVQHPTLGLLAPAARIADLEPRDSVRKLLDEFDLMDQEQEARELALASQPPASLETPSPELQPTTIPTIQAFEATLQYIPNPNPLRTLHTNHRGGGSRRSRRKANRKNPLLNPTNLRHSSPVPRPNLTPESLARRHFTATSSR